MQATLLAELGGIILALGLLGRAGQPVRPVADSAVPAGRPGLRPWRAAAAVAAVVLGGITWISSSGVIAKVLRDLGRTGNRETR